MRECETHLELAKFEPAHFAADLQRVSALGIELKTLTELNADDQRDAKLYQLHRHQHEAETNSSAFAAFDEWHAQFWQLPHLHPDAFCVAVAGGQYIGHSHAMVTNAPDLIYGFTGVLPAYRNRGIARAMKLSVLKWAKAQGYTRVRAWSDSRNKGMIWVNLHLGFTVQPPVLWMEKA
ncbi:MAG: GNAT family N-acetyltransferase [Caldilineaceae bacterium]